jgi:hypothetical protein
MWSWILWRKVTITFTTMAARSKAWTVFARSNTGIVGSNPIRVMGCLPEFILWLCCPVLCSGLAKCWSPIQRILPTVCKIHNFRSNSESELICQLRKRKRSGRRSRSSRWRGRRSYYHGASRIHRTLMPSVLRHKSFVPKQKQQCTAPSISRPRLDAKTCRIKYEILMRFTFCVL